MTQADLFPDPSPVRARRRSQVPAYQRTAAGDGDALRMIPSSLMDALNRKTA